VRGELIDCATVESDVTEDAWQKEYIKAFGVCTCVYVLTYVLKRPHDTSRQKGVTCTQV